MSFGLRIPKFWDLDKCVEYAQVAQDHGAESLWFPEGRTRNQVITMTYVGTKFDSVDVCAGIQNVYSRTPALVAMTAAYLDSISGGFRLGLGTSSRRLITGFHGYAFDAPVRRIREYVEIVDMLLDGETAEYDGRFFQLSGFALDHYDGSADIPIYVAATGETNLRMTGEFADGWLPLLVPLSGLKPAFEHLVEGARRAGRDTADIHVCPYLFTCVSESHPDRCKELVRELVAKYVGAVGEFHYRNVRRHGYEAEADDIRDHWKSEAFDKAKKAVTDDMLADFTVCGHPRDAEATVRRYRERGVDEPVAYVPPDAPDEIFRETIRHVGSFDGSSG